MEKIEKIPKPRKAGRPKGSKNKVSKEQKIFIEGLLSDTQDLFEQRFKELGNSKIPKDRDRFIEISLALNKLVVAPPREVTVKHDEEEMDKLYSIFSTWDNDLETHE